MMTLPELPPLPVDFLTPDEARAYARSYAALAVQAERERCAKLAESDDFYGSALQHAIAAAIRNQPEVET